MTSEQPTNANEPTVAFAAKAVVTSFLLNLKQMVDSLELFVNITKLLCLTSVCTIVVVISLVPRPASFSLLRAAHADLRISSSTINSGRGSHNAFFFHCSGHRAYPTVRVPDRGTRNMEILNLFRGQVSVRAPGRAKLRR